jgi:hypothetical protein
VERTGIGGVVLHSVDPARLGRWYAEHLKFDMQARPSERPAWWLTILHDSVNYCQ